MIEGMVDTLRSLRFRLVVGAVAAVVIAAWLWHRHALAVAVAEVSAGLVSAHELATARAELDALRKAAEARAEAAEGFALAAQQAEAALAAALTEIEGMSDATPDCTVGGDLADRLRAD